MPRPPPSQNASILFRWDTFERSILKANTWDAKKKLYLKNKLPITNVLIKKHDIPIADNFKHYESAELLLDEYKSYVISFLGRTRKTASQYIKDINDVWSTVDPNMALYPNQLKDPESIETMFFSLMRHEL